MILYDCDTCIAVREILRGTTTLSHPVTPSLIEPTLGQLKMLTGRTMDDQMPRYPVKYMYYTSAYYYIFMVST